MAYDRTDYFNDPTVPQDVPAPPAPPNVVNLPPQEVRAPLPPPMGGPPTSPLPTNQYVAGLVNSLEARKGITANEAMNLSAGQDRQAEIAAAEVKEQKESVARQRAMEARLQAKADQRDQEVRSMVQQTYNQKIDPEAFWKNKNTAEKIGLGIGALLSGWGQGLNKQGGNAVMGMIDKAITDNIGAQKANIDNSWKAIDKIHGLNNDAFSRDVHRQTLENNLRVAYLERVKLEVAEAIAKTSSQSVKNNGMMAIQDFSDKQMQIRNQQYVIAQQSASAAGAKLEALAKERRASSLTLKDKYIAQGYKGEALDAEVEKSLDKDFPMLSGTPFASRGQNYNSLLNGIIRAQQKKEKGLSREDAERQAREIMAANGIKDPYEGNGIGGMVSKDEQARTVNDPDSGKPVVFRDKEMANKYQEGLKPIAQSAALLRELTSLRAKHGGGFIANRDDVARVDQIKNLLIGLQGQMAATGILDKTEYKRNSDLIGDMTSYWRPWKNTDVRLGMMTQGLRNQQTALFKTYSGQDVVGPVAPQGKAPEAQSSSSASPDPFTPYGGGNVGGAQGLNPGGGGSGGARTY